MEAEASFSSVAPPKFDGDNYEMWSIRMETYLEALDLWEAVEEDYEVSQLSDNPTIAQIKIYKEKKTRKAKAKACLFAAVSPTIFPRIMTLSSAKAIWDYLKSEYKGDERIRGMQVLNLIREFEMQKMKESETIKEYSDRLMNIVNKVRLLGSEFPDSRIVQKILITVPESFETTISSLENSKDLSKITLAEVLNALQAQEQRRLIRRQSDVVEGAYRAKHNFKPCKHCGKKGHSHNKCWFRPDAKCTKCDQYGHEARVCKTKDYDHEEEAQFTYGHEGHDVLVATCYSSNVSSENWLIDSGCTNHMTYDKKIFKDLRNTNITKVKIGNGEHLTVKGIGTVVLKSSSSLKTISNVLYVPEINQNLLSVGQLVERGFKVNFEDNQCLVKNASNKILFKVKMRNKSFSLNPLKEERPTAYASKSITTTHHKSLNHDHMKSKLQKKILTQKSERQASNNSAYPQVYGQRQSKYASTWRNIQKDHQTRHKLSNSQKLSLSKELPAKFWNFRNKVKNKESLPFTKSNNT